MQLSHNDIYSSKPSARVTEQFKEIQKTVDKICIMQEARAILKKRNAIIDKYNPKIEKVLNWQRARL